MPLQPPSWTERVSARTVLVIAPHYDDEVLGCGGLLLQLASAGARIEVVFVSDGAGWPGEPGGGLAYSQQRRRESAAAAARLGIAECMHLNLPDAALSQPEHIATAAVAIAGRLAALQPDLLIAPSPLEISADHRAGAFAVHEAIQRLRPARPDAISDLQVLLYESNHASYPDVFVDISAEVPAIQSAMACYPSQQERHDYLGAVLGLRRFRTLTLPPGPTHVEGYCRLSGWDFATRSRAQLVEHVSGAIDQSHVDDGPLVSVVIRTRDRQPFLTEALSSLAASAYRVLEVILVNDGGAPPVLPEAFPFPVVRVDHPSSRGRAAAAQAGVDAARGRYVTFLDDDDLVAPEHVATLVAGARSTGARVVYTDAAVATYALDAHGAWRNTAREIPFSRDFDPDRLLVDNYIPIHTLLIERTLLSAAGPFDSSFDVFEDWDMLIRLAALARFHHIPRVTCEYRQFCGLHHSMTDASGQRPNLADGQARVVAKHRERLDPATIMRIAISLRAEAVAGSQASLQVRRLTDELTRVHGDASRIAAANQELQRRLDALTKVVPPEDVPVRV